MFTYTYTKTIVTFAVAIALTSALAGAAATMLLTGAGVAGSQSAPPPATAPPEVPGLPCADQYRNLAALDGIGQSLMQMVGGSVPPAVLDRMLDPVKDAYDAAGRDLAACLELTSGGQLAQGSLG